MIQIDFNCQGTKICLYCTEKDLMKDIFNKFHNKTNLDFLNLNFIYNQRIIDSRLSVEKIITNNDKIKKKMDILVCIKGEKNSFIKADQVICPQCGEISKISIKDYLITIYGCKNNHITKNISLNNFIKTQMVDESKIICDICKKNNKNECYKRIFFYCKICLQNLCILCKESHNKNHNIINYELKNYVCSEHGDNYYSFCQKCKKNICIACENFHSNHDLIYFAKILPKKDELKQNLEKLKNNIDKFNAEIQKIVEILLHVIENINNYYIIVKDIYDSFDIKKRNYITLSNINEIENNNIIKDLEEIINEVNIQNKFQKINIIYNKMKNIQKENNTNLTKINNFENNMNFNNINNFGNINNINNLGNNMNFNNMNNFGNRMPMQINNTEFSEFRIMNEFDRLKHGIHVTKCCFEIIKDFKITDGNIYEWRFVLRGASNSPYAGGHFHMKIIFPVNFPEKRPEFIFITPIYHLQVNPNYPRFQGGEHLGHADTSILNWWEPKTTIKEVIFDIYFFFFFQNPDSPYGLDRADLFRRNRLLFDKRAKYFTKKYADPSLPYKEYDSDWDFTCPKELNID